MKKYYDKPPVLKSIWYECKLFYSDWGFEPNYDVDLIWLKIWCIVSFKHWNGSAKSFLIFILWRKNGDVSYTPNLLTMFLISLPMHVSLSFSFNVGCLLLSFAFSDWGHEGTFHPSPLRVNTILGVTCLFFLLFSLLAFIIPNPFD